MVTSKLIIVADKVIRDTDDNISVINILEDIVAESFPITLPQITIVLYLNKDVEDPNEVMLNFTLKNNESILKDHNLKVEFKQRDSTRVIIQLRSIQFNDPGIATFEFKLSNDNLDHYQIGLQLRESISISNS